MITGFDAETGFLTPYEELTLVPVVIAGLRVKIGKERAVKNAYICEMLKRKGLDINEARLRKIINYIRTNNLVIGLIATSGGYYVASTKKEMEDYASSLLGRENAIKHVRESIESQMAAYY